MSLAFLLVATADPFARTLFLQVAAEHDIFAAWLGAAAAARSAGQAEQAAADLAMALASHVLFEAHEVGVLADAIVRGSQARGWCHVGPDRLLGISPGDDARLVVRADGRRVPWRQGDAVPPNTNTVSITDHGRHLLGSPLRIARMFRIEGVVSVTDGGVAGWAWHPGAPDLPPELLIEPAGKFPVTRLRLSGPAPEGLGPYVRARGFEIALSELPVHAGAIHVHGADGRALTGSPLFPGAEQCLAAAIAHGIAGGETLVGIPSSILGGASVAAAIKGSPVHAEPAPNRSVVVVIPVHRGLRVTLDCIASVRATVPAGTRIVAVDDATPEPALALALDRLAADGAITLIRRPVSGGFPAAANAGLRAAAPHDVVLLNSDTLVPRGWLAALRALVHAEPDIGTATPLSNDATLVSYPQPGGGNPHPSKADTRRLAALAARVNRGIAVEIPTAVGFCMYIRRECFDSVGALREDLFAQGYGEENDFCLRARHLGWRHVAAPGVFVAHLGGASFGAARPALLARNGAVIERRYPGYDAMIAAHGAQDPLASARFRLDSARWAAGRRPTGATILVTHDSGGGVERAIRARCVELRAAGFRAIVLRPVPVRDGEPEPEHPGDAYRRGLCAVGDGVEGGFPNLRFALPDQLPALARLLRRDRPDRVEIHHLLGHHHAVTGLAALLGVPVEVHVHDYACICPRITLIGPERRFCGEPLDPGVCDACVADAGRLIEEAIPTAALRVRSAADFAAAARVVVPSRDVARRLDRHFPGLRVQLQPSDHVVRGQPDAPLPGGPCRVAVIGGIGIEKGYEILLGCARDAAARKLALEFVVVGHTMDDARLFDTGRVFVTGPYEECDGEALVRTQRAHLAWLPSICPETWSFTLSLAWQAGLRVAVFDIGVPAERVRLHALTSKIGGWALPLGAPPSTINDALIVASRQPDGERFSLRAPARKTTSDRLGAYIHG